MHNHKNLAVYEGDLNIILSLTADPNNARWTVVPTSDEFGSYQISDYGGYRDPSLTGLFYPNQSGLVILNATTAPNGENPISTAGLYIAQCSNGGNRTGSKLLVIREYFNLYYILSDYVQSINSSVAVIAYCWSLRKCNLRIT